MVTCGAVFGAGIGLAAPRYLDALLYEVKPTGLDVLVRAVLAMAVLKIE